MNKMKYLFGLLLMTCALTAFAQPGMDDDMDENRREKIETLKRAYISEKLDLTVTEAEKFWPIYNEFDNKREAVRKNMRTTQKKLKAGDLAEKETIQMIDQIGQYRKEEVDLESKFLKDCMPVLGVDKVLKLAVIQKEFQKELMQKMKERRQEMRDQRPGQRRG